MPPVILFLTALLLLSGCGSYINLDDNQSVYKNPNPEIERLHVEAYNLYHGIGVVQNRVKANRLYLMAARAGDTRSMLNLSINLLNGYGTEPDVIEGFAWIDAARFLTQRSRDMQVKWRVRAVYDSALTELTAAQIERGRKRAKYLIEHEIVGIPAP